MLELDHQLKLDRDTILATNVAEEFAADDLKKIGAWVWDGYTLDQQSRSKWSARTEAAMDLAMQLQKVKSFPWANCSNVAFPLITLAVLQFHARAYPALIQAPQVVKCRVLVQDADGQEAARAARAARVSTHMSWQRLEQDQPWEEEWDRGLINTSVVGCTFRKTYRDAQKGYDVDQLVYAKDLVLDYWARSVEDCPRKTHIIPLFRNDIYEDVKRGIFCDVLDAEWYRGNPQPPTSTAQSAQHDARTGQAQPARTDETTPFITLEQHVNLDLDGDGYAEPWIITIEERSKAVLRIVSALDDEKQVVRNSKGEVVRCNPVQYFTKVPFLPSPDGGIYDMGFGVLLGPLNESVNSIVNQLIDAGTFKNTRGWLLGRGAKMRGGVYNFKPFEAVRIDSSGDDIRKNVIRIEAEEPSSVLFQLLVLLIEYTNRIPGTTEVSVGENPGQNTPAETSRNMLAQGLKIYNAIFKRIWRAMGEEFKKLYALNALHMQTRQDFGKGQYALPEDYRGDVQAIVPEADPNVSSDAERQQQMLFVAQRMFTVPGYNIEAAERALLKAWRVPDTDMIYPGPGKVPPLPNPKAAVEQIKLQGKQMQIQAQAQTAAAELLETHRLNTAKILQLGAQSAKLIEEAGGIKTGHAIAALEAVIGALKLHNDSILKHAEILMKSAGGGEKEGENGNSGRENVGRLAQAPGDAGLALLGQGGEGLQEGAVG